MIYLIALCLILVALVFLARADARRRKTEMQSCDAAIASALGLLERKEAEISSLLAEVSSAMTNRRLAMASQTQTPRVSIEQLIPLGSVLEYETKGRRELFLDRATNQIYEHVHEIQVFSGAKSAKFVALNVLGPIKFQNRGDTASEVPEEIYVSAQERRARSRGQKYGAKGKPRGPGFSPE